MTSGYTILYVEDDLDDLLLIAEAFQQYTDHLTVIHAANGKEGLATLKKMKERGSLPCLLIADINMPVMDGKEMIQKLRAVDDYKDLPVVLFSTSSSVSDQLFAQSMGAAFITKPQRFNDLKALVAEFVKKCRFEMESSLDSHAKGS